MGLKYDILGILSDGKKYDTLGLKRYLIALDEKYQYVTLDAIGKWLRKLEKNGDVRITTKTRANKWGEALPGRRLLRCQITRHGLKKVEYLYKKGLIRKKLITALG